MSGTYTANLADMQAWARGIMESRAPDFVIGDDPERPYMRRWWVIPRNDQCNVYLHEILRSDDDRAGHDHPWANTSFLIEGQYHEVIYDRAQPWIEVARHVRRAGSTVTRDAADTHRLIVPEGGRAVSLFMTGPKVRDWGFWCPGESRASPGGDETREPRFVPWQVFTDDANKGRVGKGCGA